MQPGLKDPLRMLCLASAGMLAGLAIDAAAGGFDRLAALCAGTPPGWGRLLAWHWSELPLTHGAMLLSSLAAVPHPGRLLSCGWMLLGMSAGSCLAGQTAGAAPGALLAGMWLGMAGGMAAGEAAAALVRNPTTHCRTGP